MNEFKTIKEKVTEEIIEKRSKFIANIYPVETVEEAENIIKQTKRTYHDARHNCFAYSVMQDGKVINRFSDDGEPSGTAGAPILNIITNNQLCNVLVIVTRYFGGILLGTGGLVRAYSDSTMKALSNSEDISKILGYIIEVIIEYENLQYFKYFCSKKNINIKKIEYLEKIKCIIEVAEEEKKEIFSKKMEENKKIPNGKLNLLKAEILAKTYITKYE